LHDAPQTPAAQLAVAFAPAAQARPQAPQCARLAVVATSQPSAATPLQSPKPALHENPQAPAPVQTGDIALAGVGQGATVAPRPSALQALRVVAEAQVALPGTQTHEVHIDPAQVDEPGHGSVDCVNPSALHTRTVRPSAQVDEPGTHARSRHTPSAQRCVAVQAVGVVPRPSALHTARVEASEQVTVPGTQARATHAPSRQLSVDAHATALVPRPSALHTLRALIDAHVAAPGTHVRATQDPSRHDCPSAQGVEAYPPPSALHTRRWPVAGSQLAAPGEHTTAWQRPSRQVSAAAHGTTALAAPRTSQVRWCVASSQRVSDGAHACRRQVLSVAQKRPIGQSTSALHSTHTLRVLLHTRPIAVQSRDERHATGRSTHADSRHCWVAGHSASSLQSTQNPSVGEHTCPGQVRDEVQRVTA
jgi:hypothetical protein